MLLKLTKEKFRYSCTEYVADLRQLDATPWPLFKYYMYFYNLNVYTYYP